jgi:hypothetical protein
LGAYQPVQPLGCRCCGAGLTEEVADLGLVPLSPDPVRVGAGWRPLACAPLRLLVCSDCRLVQVGATGAVGRNHAPRAGQDFAAGIAQRLRLGPGTPVAAFDAEALAPFRDRDIPASTIPTGALMALRLREALPPPVLLLGGPLLANAPDLRDALEGVRTLLAPGGVCVLAQPYDWSTSATAFDQWIGGHSQRGFEQGDPAATVRALLDGRHPGAIAGLELLGEVDDLPWIVRMHDRAQMHYRCHLVAVRRAG